MRTMDDLLELNADTMYTMMATNGIGLPRTTIQRHGKMSAVFAKEKMILKPSKCTISLLASSLMLLAICPNPGKKKKKRKKKSFQDADVDE